MNRKPSNDDQIPVLQDHFLNISSNEPKTSSNFSNLNSNLSTNSSSSCSPRIPTLTLDHDIRGSHPPSELIQNLNSIFDSLEEDVLHALRKVRCDIIKSVSIEAQVEKNFFEKSCSQSDIEDLIKKTTFECSNSLRASLQHYSSILKSQNLTRAFHRQIQSVLNTLAKSFNGIKEDLGYLTDMIGGLNGGEVPDVLDVKKLKTERTVFAEQSSFPHCIQYITEYDMIVTGDCGGRLCFWNAKDLNKILVKKVHDSGTFHLKYEPKFRVLIAGYENGYVKVFRLNKKLVQEDSGRENGVQLISTMNRRQNGIRSILSVPERGLFLIAGRDSNIDIYSFKDFNFKGCLNTSGKSGIGYQIMFIPQKDIVVAGFKDGLIALYNLTTRTEICQLETGANGWSIDALRYIESEDAILASTSSGTLTMWKFSGAKIISSKKQFKVKQTVYKILGYQDEERVLLGTASNKLMCLNLKTEEMEESEKTDIDECTGLLYLSKYNKLVVADWESRKISMMKLE